MKIENSIGWCDATINAVTGCEKVSPGCKNCYAESGTRARVLRAQGIETWGPNGVRHPVNFEPVFRRLNKLCICDKCHEGASIALLGQSCSEPHPSIANIRCAGMRRRIRLFADSNSDIWDPHIHVEILAKYLHAIRIATNLDVILLTKRIEQWYQRLLAVEMFYAKQESGNDEEFLFIDDWLQGRAPAHVWGLVSVENQKCADERIPQLLKTPFAVRGLSVEPLLENIQLSTLNSQPPIDWVIVGGESGLNRRDCGAAAIEDVVQQGVSAGVPVYCKQDCHFYPSQRGRLSDRAWSRKEFPKMRSLGSSMLNVER